MAKRGYTRFTIEEREILFKRIAEGKSQESIAKELSRDPSTISREIRRNGMCRSTYRLSCAEKHAKQESLKRKKKFKLIENQELASFVEKKLKERWSPEQIAGFLKKEHPNSPKKHISHETIYRHIYFVVNKEDRELLANCLRQSRKRRKPRKRVGGKRTKIRNLVPIHNRPSEVEEREKPGHWEGDLIIGKDHKSAIGTLLERTSGYIITIPFGRDYTTKNVVLGFAAALGILPAHMKKSLTYDRGTEMAGHEIFTMITEIPVFFADPYSPWQRGSNENGNGLIRDYLPKGTDFRLIPDEQILEISRHLNIRPRKRLDFFDPSTLMEWFCQNKGKTKSQFYTYAYPSAL